VSGTHSLPLEAGTRADGEDSRSRSWTAAERGAKITCGTNPSGILKGGGGRRHGSATAAAATVAGVDGADAGARGTGRPRVAGAAVFQSSILIYVDCPIPRNGEGQDDETKGLFGLGDVI
jgi:hypothetical protein